MFLGCEIGGTKLQVGVVSGRGQLRQLVRLPVDRAAGRAGILRQFTQIIPGILRDYPVQAIGVGFGGPVDSGRGRVVRSHQIAGWSGFELRRWFARQFQLPVAVENDSNCAALAEARTGAGRGERVVFYTNIGTGIGGGLVIDGQLYSGRYGAMEIGHTRAFNDPLHTKLIRFLITLSARGPNGRSLLFIEHAELDTSLVRVNSHFAA